MAFNFIVPILVYWFLFRFPQITYAKIQFFLVEAFPNQFFQTIESAKHAFAAMAGLGKPAFLHVLLLENEKQNSNEVTWQCFPFKSKVTCKNVAHLEGKKISLKSHLGYLCGHSLNYGAAC